MSDPYPETEAPVTLEAPPPPSPVAYSRPGPSASLPASFASNKEYRAYIAARELEVERAKIDRGLKETAGRLYETRTIKGKADPAATALWTGALANAQKEGDQEAIAHATAMLAAARGEDKEELVWVGKDDPAQVALSAIDYAKAVAAGSGADTAARAGPAVESYLTTESRKTREIERQYQDFKDRVKLYYDLLGQEQAFNQRADDQNTASEKAIRSGDAEWGGIPRYTYRMWDDSLANQVRPTISDYLRPDYRLNQAAGLPGPEGFDNPNFDENGFPQYAMGTTAISPEIRAMIGRPLGFHPGPVTEPFEWPWRAR